MQIYSYVQKRCPSCGNDELLDYTRSGPLVYAMYGCECQWTDPGYSAKYDFHSRLRLNFERFMETLPEHYAEYALKAFEPHLGSTEARSAARAVASGERRMLYLYGDAGRGKTHLAVSAAMDLLNQLKSVEYVSELGLMDAYREHAGGGETVVLPQVILLDDLAKDGSRSEFYAKSLYRVMESAFNGRTLIITSNHSPEDAAERIALDESNRRALVSRFRAGLVAEMRGDDQRGGTL